MFTQPFKKILPFGLLVFLVLSFSTRKTDAFEKVHFIQELRTGLESPVDVEVAPTGAVFVLDEKNAQINVFEADGNFRQNIAEPGSGQGQLRSPQSLAVAPRGRLVVADTGNNRVQVFNKIGKFLFSFGQPGTLPGQFRSPSGVIVDQFGFIFVADRDNRRIQVFSPNGLFFHSFDTAARPVDLSIDPQRNLYVLVPEIGKVVKYTPQGEKIQEISCVMDKKNYLEKAQRLAVDRRGDIYISERMEQTIKKFDKNESVLITFGSEGEGRGQFQDAQGLAADVDGKIYVADTKNKRVQIFEILGSEKSFLTFYDQSPLVLDFDSTIPAEKAISDIHSVPGLGLYMVSDKTNRIFVKGNTREQIGERGEAPGQFQAPQGLSVALDGRIFVADTGNHRIQILDKDGKLNHYVGTPGGKAGQFLSPADIAVDSKGNIYVADSRNDRVQIFNFDGIFLDAFGPNNGKMLGSVPLRLRNPLAVAVDSRDRVYVLDSGNHRIQVFDEHGEFIELIGGPGSGPGQFDEPVDIALDKNDNLYVADQGNHRIQIFDAFRKPVMAFGSPGKGGGYFQKISSVAVSENKIFVADYESDEIQVFQYPLQKISERVYATQSVLPPQDLEGNSIARYSAAETLATREAIDRLFKNFENAKPAWRKYVRIDSVEILNDGEVKVTVSLPRNVSQETAVSQETVPDPAAGWNEK